MYVCVWVCMRNKGRNTMKKRRKKKRRHLSVLLIQISWYMNTVQGGWWHQRSTEKLPECIKRRHVEICKAYINLLAVSAKREKGNIDVRFNWLINRSINEYKLIEKERDRSIYGSVWRSDIEKYMHTFKGISCVFFDRKWMNQSIDKLFLWKYKSPSRLEIVASNIFLVTPE